MPHQAWQPSLLPTPPDSVPSGALPVGALPLGAIEGHGPSHATVNASLMPFPSLRHAQHLSSAPKRQVSPRFPPDAPTSRDESAIGRVSTYSIRPCIHNQRLSERYGAKAATKARTISDGIQGGASPLSARSPSVRATSPLGKGGRGARSGTPGAAIIIPSPRVGTAPAAAPAAALAAAPALAPAAPAPAPAWAEGDQR